MKLKAIRAKNQKKERTIQAYYVRLWDGVEPETQRRHEMNVNRSLVLILGMPIAMAGGAFSGYLIGGGPAALLMLGLTGIAIQFDLHLLNAIHRKSLRVYHEMRGGREPRPWVRKERGLLGPIMTGELAPVQHPVVEARLLEGAAVKRMRRLAES